MAPGVGKTLGHYEITGLLGKGGMGEVALKVLPAALAGDTEYVARFMRFAKCLTGGEVGDGNIVAALSRSGVLSRIPAQGGSPRPLTTLPNELTHRWPQALPGADAVSFTAHTAGMAGRAVQAQHTVTRRLTRARASRFSLEHFPAKLC